MALKKKTGRSKKQAVSNQATSSGLADSKSQTIAAIVENCIKEQVNAIKAFDKEHLEPGKVLDWLSTAPGDTALHVMKDLAAYHYPEVDVNSKDDLDSIVASALGFCGTKNVFEKLKPILKEAIISTSLVRMNATFEIVKAAPVALLPTVLGEKTAKLRHVGWRFQVATAGSPIYPETLLHATSTISSLKDRMPHLDKFTVFLDLQTHRHDFRGLESHDWLQWPSTCYMSAAHDSLDIEYKIIDMVMDDLLRAVAASGIGTK